MKNNEESFIKITFDQEQPSPDGVNLSVENQYVSLNEMISTATAIIISAADHMEVPASLVGLVAISQLKGAEHTKPDADSGDVDLNALREFLNKQ